MFSFGVMMKFSNFLLLCPFKTLLHTAFVKGDILVACFAFRNAGLILLSLWGRLGPENFSLYRLYGLFFCSRSDKFCLGLHIK